MCSVISPQLMRHQRQNMPAWMRLTMAMLGFLFPREALFPRLRGEQRWRDFPLVLASALVPPPTGTRDQTLRDGTVWWNTGLEFFVFWLNMKMRWRKHWSPLDGDWWHFVFSVWPFCFCFCFCLSKKEPLRLKRYFRNICKIAYFVQ